MLRAAFPAMLRTRHSDPAWLRYVCGLGVWLVSFTLQMLMDSVTPSSPFLVFIPGLMLVTWLWGWGPTLLYFATTSVAVSIYFVPRDEMFHFTDPIEVTTSLQFILVAIPVIYIVERLVDARRQLDSQLRSITELSTQQQTLLEEINHRVKNHLQAIIALMPTGPDERIDQIRVRMLVLARVYDKLRLKSAGAQLDSEGFLAGLTSDLQKSLAQDGQVALDCSVDCGPLGSKEAVFLGLIANEAVSNALKYAFPEGRGEIHTSLHEHSGKRTLIVQDNGAGDAGESKGTGQGLRLMRRLATDLAGEVRLGGAPGYFVIVTYPSPTLAG